jgi:alkylresorcinol/alkylpyrone synthase
MSSPPRIVSLSTAVPPYVLRQDEVAAAAAGLFAPDMPSFERLSPVYRNAAIDTRRSCVPLSWYLEPHGFAERNQLFVDNAVSLLEQASTEAVEAAGCGFEGIDMLLTISSSGVATPSLDAQLLDRLPFRRDVQRLPVFGLGCAGGVLGLGRAAALARAEPGCRILLLDVELCGLTFRRNDMSKSNIVATALFGDGAAAAVLTTDGVGPAVVGWGEHTWPQSLDVMGWDVRDDGLAVLFSRDIPALVRASFREAAETFLGRHGLALEGVDDFVCHPGGAKVLDAIEAVFGLSNEKLDCSRDILRRYGNMSSATVLFVLAESLRRRSARLRLLSSLGPGFTAGFALLEDAAA